MVSIGKEEKLQQVRLSLKYSYGRVEAWRSSQRGVSSFFKDSVTAVLAPAHAAPDPQNIWPEAAENRRFDNEVLMVPRLY